VLGLQPGRHRHTYELMSAALILSGIAVHQFKNYFRVQRPADRSALVQPVLQTPNHAAYPAGHASQCHLLADVLDDLVGGAGGDVTVQLGRLADRIGENRVVAGVHYLEDISAGKKLGQDLAKHFIDLAKYEGDDPTTALQWLWTNAAAEWP